MKDIPLVFIAEGEHIFQEVKMISNWNKDIVVCTNGKDNLTTDEKDILAQKQIEVIETEISQLQKKDGQLKAIQFKNGRELHREAGFVSYKNTAGCSFCRAIGLRDE